MGKILNREPAMILAAASALIMFLSAFVFHFTPDQQGALNAVAAGLVGVLTWVSVAEDGRLALITGLMKALIALGVAFGLHMAADQQAVLMTLVTTFAQLFVRSQVTAPVDTNGVQVR